jgi:amino acid transporter
MAEVASIYLPAGAAMFVTVGAIAAIMTALNGTIFVPSRLAITFVEDGLAPRWLGFINKKTATPIRGLTLTMLCCAVLLISGQLSLALNVAVFALVVLYFLHSLVFLFLPRLNPALASEVKSTLPRRVQQAAAVVSLLSMGLMIVIQLQQDAVVLSSQTLSQRINGQSLTSIELIFVWSIIGAGLYQLARMQRGSSQVSKAHGD